MFFILLMFYQPTHSTDIRPTREGREGERRKEHRRRLRGEWKDEGT